MRKKCYGSMIDALQLIFLLGVILTGCRGDANEYRLVKDLMTNYDNSVRPVTVSTAPLQVVFGMSLHLIIDVDERNQILTTNCWLTQKWNDSHLTWNASDYGDIHVVRIPYQKVWRPDIILYNNADAQYSSSVINTNVIVSDNGEVVWLSHGIFRSSCDINVEYFPFDLQSCEMKWASWTYDGFQIDLQKQTEVGDVSNYQTNGEFDLMDFEAIRHEEYYSCCPEPYPDITYVIKMKRRPLFYVFNLILPCLLINGIALLVFYVPSESGEKVTLGISALLSMTVFLMTIRESLPPTEKTPLISLYYGVSICLVSFASGLSVVTLNLHHRGLRGTEVPYLLRRIVLGGLARMVFLKFEVERPGSPAAASRAEASAQAQATAFTTGQQPSTPARTTELRCNCPHRDNNSGRSNSQFPKVRPKSLIATTRASGWHPTPSNGMPPLVTRISEERLRLRIQDIQEASNSSLANSVMDSDIERADNSKFQNELDYLGLGPPSPRFCTRRSTAATQSSAPLTTSPITPLLVSRPTHPSNESVESSGTDGGGGSTSRFLNGINEHRLTQLLARVSLAVERNEIRLEDQDRREAIALEWKQLALVCDRFLLLTFVIITTVATCVVLTSSPHGP